MSDSLALNKDTSVLLIIDVQERLAAAMPPDVMGQLTRNTNILVEAARRLGIPVLVSEQYPQGLGATVADIAEGFAGLETLHRFEKVDFSVCAVDAFRELADSLQASGRVQWIVAGMETHICVYQSARALVERGQKVHVVSDAVVSRTKGNFKVGLGLAEKSGATLSSTETVVMDLLGRAKGDDFKAISKLIR